MAKKPTSYNGPPPSIRDPKTGRMAANPEYAKWKAEQEKLAQEEALRLAQEAKAKEDAKAAKIAERQRKAEEKAAKAQERQNKAAQKAAEKAEKQAKLAEQKAKAMESPIPDAPGAYKADRNGLLPGQAGYDFYDGKWGTADDPRLVSASNTDNSPEAVAKRSAALKAQRDAARAANTMPQTNPLGLPTFEQRYGQKRWMEQTVERVKTGKQPLAGEPDAGMTLASLANLSKEELAEVDLDQIEELHGVKKLIIKAAQQRIKREVEDAKERLAHEKTDDELLQEDAAKRKKARADAIRDRMEVEEYLKAGHGIRMALSKSMLSGVNKLSGDKLSAKGMLGLSHLLLGKTGTNALIEKEEDKDHKANKAVMKMAEANEKSAKHLERMERGDKKHYEHMEHLSLEHAFSIRGLIAITKKGFEKLMPKPSMTNRLMWAGGMGLFSGILNRNDDNNFFGSMLKGLLGEEGSKALDGMVSPIEQALGITDETRKTLTQGSTIGMGASLLGLTPGVLGSHAIGAIGDIFSGNPISGLLKLLALGGGGMLVGQMAGSQDPITTLKDTFVDFKNTFMKIMTQAIEILRRTFNAISLVATGFGKIFGEKVDLGHFEDDGTWKPNLDKDGSVKGDETDGAMASVAKWAAENPKTAFMAALAVRYGSIPALKVIGSAGYGLAQGVVAGATSTAATGAAAGAAGAGAGALALPLTAFLAASTAAIFASAKLGDWLQDWLDSKDWYKAIKDKAAIERKEESDTGKQLFAQRKINVLANPDAKSLQFRIQRYNMANPDDPITPEDIEKYNASKVTPTKKFAENQHFTADVNGYQAPKQGVTVNNIKQGDTIVNNAAGGAGLAPGVGNAVAPTNVWEWKNWGLPQGVR